MSDEVTKALHRWRRRLKAKYKLKDRYKPKRRCWMYANYIHWWRLYERDYIHYRVPTATDTGYGSAWEVREDKDLHR